MLSRAVAAASAAAFAFVATIVPADAAARGGGGGIGMARGGFHHHTGLRHFHHRPIARARAFHHHPRFGHPTGTRFVHPLRAAPLASSSGAVLRVHVPRGGFRHGHFVAGGWPITVWGGSAFYGSYYDPSDDDVLYTARPVVDDPPDDATPVAASRAPVGLMRYGCRSQDVSVTSPSGGERTVTVTRC
jgi:hypothetical protein